MPLILLEGVDGAGKTTLAAQLAAMWTAGGDDGRTAKIIHRTATFATPTVFDEYENALTSYHPGSGQLLILDRWHVSEVVYGHILRGRSRLTRGNVKHINQFLTAKGALEVIMTAPVHTIIDRLNARGETYLPIHKVTEVVKAYIAWARDFDWVLAKPNTVRPTMLINAAVALEKTTKLLDLPPSYAGSHAPKYVIGAARTTDAPVPFQDNGGTWTIVANSGALYADEITPELLHRLGSPTIFAYDDEAAKVIASRGVGSVDVF